VSWDFGISRTQLNQSVAALHANGDGSIIAVAKWWHICPSTD
jgi:hypothetical protein